MKTLDTPDHIRKMQCSIFLKNSVQRRFELGIEMIEDVKKITENSIRLKNPAISEIDLKIEMLKRFYTKDFSEEKMNDIIQSFKDIYFLKQSNAI
jgi:hypothetical protein